MIGRTNVGGGGSASAWAYIAVTYPSGSTCSATNGSVTLTAQGTSGRYVFQIPEPTSTPEIWTVSCTDGTQTKSETVSISSQYQCANILLSYARLPVEYQEVEYLESSGTQFIYIGLIENFANYEIDLTYMNFGLVGTLACGCAHSSAVLFGVYTNADGLQYRYGGYFASRKGVNKRISVVINNANGQIVEDGVVLGSGTITGSYYFGMFCEGRNNGTVSNVSTSRIYACAIKNKLTDTAVYDFVPCYRRADNVSGFYDLANNEFLTNGGSGTFTVGPDV